LYVVVRRYRLAGSGSELARRVRSDYLDVVSKLPGFRSFQVVDCGGVESLSISHWDSKADAERSDEVARRWIAQHALGILPFPPERLAGDVVMELTR
jgi:heme-degrading monooxygenase HmoA